MALQECSRFTWSIQFWAQLFSFFTPNYKTPHLPDSVIFNILSRLPARRVSVCRRVCKKWLELTSTIDFAHTHLQRHTSNTKKVLLLQCLRVRDFHEPDYGSFFTLKKEAKWKRTFKKIRPDLNAPVATSYFPILYGSFNGILVFKTQSFSYNNYLLNPTTHERINIRCDGGVLCGFFFHPSKKEYELLFNRATYYFLFSLESESLLKVFTFPYHSTTNQAYSNGSVYWIIDYNSNKTCQNSVMAFNVETGVFSSFPHPDKLCGPTCNREDMNLLENSGQLLFCRMHKVDYINLWVLENDDNVVWVKRYVVHLDWDLKLYPFKDNNRFVFEICKMKDIAVLNVDNGELLLFWKERGLFVYNLDKKKVRKIDHKEMHLKGKLRYVLSASCYVKSLVSLKVPMKHPNSGKFPTYGQVTIDLR